MKAFYSFIFCAALFMTSCDTTDDSTESIKITGDTTTEIAVNADDNTHNITFNAALPWTATVKDITVSRADEVNSPDWIQLSNYSGEAGNVTLTISFTKNLTGALRKAEIVITCGNSFITITIEQKTENSTGTVTKLVKEMQYEQQYYSERIENPDLEFGKTVAVFNYDDKGRVSSINMTDDESGEQEVSVDYSSTNKINISVKYASEPEGGTMSVITLDNKGNAISVQAKEVDYSEFIDVVSFGYTDDGRLGKVTFPNKNNDKDEAYSLHYDENGYLTKIKDVNDNTGDNEILFDIPTFYPNKYPNNCMIDMFAFLDMTNRFDYVFWLGRAGKTSDYILEKAINTRGNDNVIPGESSWVPASMYKPGDVLYESSFTNVELDDYYQLECEYDNDKNLSKLTRKLKYDVIEETYHNVVTDKVVTGDNGEKFYIADTKLVRTEKVDEGYDYDVYTFKY